MRYREGTLVVYKEDNLLGLVCGGLNYRVGSRIGCWWHKGASRGFIHTDEVEILTLDEVLQLTFSNEKAKASLLERRLRLINDDGEVDIPINDEDVRIAVVDMINKNFRGKYSR